MAIERLQMAPLVARFLSYVQTAGRRNLNLDIEWLHTASILIQWKSRSLLPQEPATEPTRDAIRGELIGQLGHHRQQLADDLKRRHTTAAASLGRRRSGPGIADYSSLPLGGDDLPFVSVWDLPQQHPRSPSVGCQYRAEREQWPEVLELERDITTIAEMVEVVRAALASSPSGIDGAELMWRETRQGGAHGFF